jgi:L-xylulokinase
MVVSRTLLSSGLTGTLLYDLPGTYLNSAAGCTSAANLEWFAKEFGGSAAVEAEKRGVSKFDVISEAAATIPPGKTDVLYLPYIATPNVHHYGRASFSNMGMGHTFADLSRACFEGMTYDHKRYFEMLENIADIPAVRLSGGGAKSAFWSQMFADVLNKPVEVLEADELGALGAAMVAAIGAGIYKSHDEALERLVNVRARFEPIDANVKAYANRYKSYSAMVKVMCDAWDKKIIEQS